MASVRQLKAYMQLSVLREKFVLLCLFGHDSQDHRKHVDRGLHKFQPIPLGHTQMCAHRDEYT